MGLLQSNTVPKIGGQLYNLLPSRYRFNDHSSLLCTGETEELKFCERFCRVFGDNLDRIRTIYTGLLDYWEPRYCDADILEYLAQNYGWSLDTSLDVGFQRILLQNIQLVYNLAGRKRALWYLIYAHTGITVKVHRANDENALVLNHITFLTSDYTGGYTINVNDAGPISEGDKIWQWRGSTKAHAIVESVSGNEITLKIPFSYSMPADMGSKIIHNSGSVDGLPGVSGRNLFVADVTPCGFGILGHSADKLMSATDRAQLLTLVITWPYEPTTAQKAIATSIVEYCLPARSHYTFRYLDRTPNEFYADFSHVDFRDVLN